MPRTPPRKAGARSMTPAKRIKKKVVKKAGGARKMPARSTGRRRSY